MPQTTPSIPPVPIGTVLEFRCNGMATRSCVVVGEPNFYGAQDAIDEDGIRYRWVYADMVHPDRAQAGVGFYQPRQPRSVSPERVEALKAQCQPYHEYYHYAEQLRHASFFV